MVWERTALAWLQLSLFDLPGHNVQILLETLHRQTTKEVKGEVKINNQTLTVCINIMLVNPYLFVLLQEVFFNGTKSATN